MKMEKVKLGIPFNCQKIMNRHDIWGIYITFNMINVLS